MAENVTITSGSILDRFILRSRDIPFITGETVCTRVGDGCTRISNCSCDTEGGDSGC